jgi:hypothetical protein
LITVSTYDFLEFGIQISNFQRSTLRISMQSYTRANHETALCFLQFLFVSIYLVASLILVYGYRFPSDNHHDLVPPIFSMLHNDLFRSDYFVGEMLQFTPRTYYMYLIYTLARAGLSVPSAYFLLYGITLASFVFGLQAIARRVCRSDISASVLVFWGLVVSAGTIGGSTGPLAFFSNTPLPALYALGLSIWGIYFSLRRLWPLAYVFFSLACLVQFLVGLLPALLLSPLLIRDAIQTRRVVPAMLALLCLGIGAALVYVPMLLQGTTSGEVLSNREFVRLYALRIPHHIVPSSWSTAQWGEFLLFYLGGALCIKKAKSLQPALRFGLLAIIGLALGSLIINILFVEIFPLAFVAKLQLARTTPFGQLAILVGLAALFDEHFQKRNWAVVVPLVVIPVSHFPGLMLSLFAGALRRLEALTPNLRARADLAIFALVVVGFYPWISAESPPFLNAILTGPVLLLILLTPYILERVLRSARLVTLAACSLACLSVGLLAGGLMDVLPSRLERLFQSKVALYRLDNDDVTKLAQRFREKSDKDALVLVPPSVSQFRLHSLRSVVVDFKSFPLTDQGMIKWAERMEAVLGIPLRPGLEFRKSDALYSSRPAPALVEVAQHYHAQYVLSRRDWHPDMPGEEVDSERSWVIWRLSASSA